MNYRMWFCGLVLTIAAPALLASDPETILLPIAFQPGVTRSGLRGTAWQGELWLRNSSSARIALSSVGCLFNECNFAYYPANYEGLVTEPLDGDPDGGFLLTPRQADLPALTFSSRVIEVAKHAQPQGLELPVVREAAFLSGSRELLGVPGGDAVRVALRLYDPRRRQNPSVQVEIVDSTTGEVRGKESVFLVVPAIAPFGVLRPGFAVIYDLGGLFPVIKTLARFHVRVTPIGWTEYWAMVSVTDNETGQVLIISPQ